MTTATTAQQYFQAYLVAQTNTPSVTPTVSQIPQDVTLETLIALSTFRPTAFQGSVLQKYPQNFEIVQNKIKNDLITRGATNLNRLENFVPSVYSGNAIQRRRNAQIIPLNNRQIILRGLDPRTSRLVQNLQDLRFLNDLQRKLQRYTDRLEAQINRFSALLNALVNAPDAAASAAISVLIGKLQQLEDLYTRIKAVLTLVRNAAVATYKQIVRSFGTDLPKGVQKVKKGIEVARKILSLREIPRIRLFPKFPKLPRVSFSRIDFYQKYKKALDNLKKQENQFYAKAYDIALRQSGFEIVDPNKDRIQRGLTRARNSLREARAKLQASQARRTEAINSTRKNLIRNIRETNSTVERERLRLLQQYQNAKNIRSQIGAARRYLTQDEISTLISVPALAERQFNIFKEPTTGETTRDGKTVYSDVNNRKYVLISARDRVQQTVNAAALKVQSNIATVTRGVDTINQAIDSVANLSTSLNNKQLAGELAAGFVQEAQIANNLSSAASAAVSQKLPASDLENEQPFLSVDTSGQFSEGGEALISMASNQDLINIEYSLDRGQSWKPRIPENPDRNVFSIKGLTNGQPYVIVTRGIRRDGTRTKNSNFVGYIPGDKPIDPPRITSVSLDGLDPLKIRISFRAPVSDNGTAIQDYQYSLDGGRTWAARFEDNKPPLSLLSPMIVYFWIPGGGALKYGTTYNIQIRAINAKGVGPASNTVVFTTPQGANLIV